MVTADRHQDIMTALRIQKEFGFDMVLDSATEAYTLIDEIKSAGIPVFVHPTMKRARGEAEHLTFENAALLADAGIPIALQSGYEAYVPKTRVLLFEAGIAAARTGNTCRDLFLAMAAVIAELDDSGGDIGRLGHGLGMQLTEQPSHAAFDRTELRENMVLTLEPSLSYGDGLMMVHEENIVVTASGGRLLTARAAPDLPVI